MRQSGEHDIEFSANPVVVCDMGGKTFRDMGHGLYINLACDLGKTK